MRILLLGAGGPAGVNALKALHRAGHELTAYDANAAHLIWCEPWAETTSELDLEDISDFDLILAQPDALVLLLAGEPRTFLPPKTTIQRCQDKPFAVRQWELANLRSGCFELEEPWPDHLQQARERFGLPFWLRATEGAGAKGAIKVSSLDQAYHWIRFWETRERGFSWMAEEFFPGRDLAWSSIWYMGKLITSFTRERVEYLYPHLTPEGLTGTPTIARVVHDAAVNLNATNAVLAIDPKPHGIFCVDLREDERGHPRPTEINAGRGFTTLGLWSLHSTNFLNIAAQCGIGNGVIGAKRYDALPEGLTLSRHIDCEAQFTMARKAVAA